MDNCLDSGWLRNSARNASYFLLARIAMFIASSFDKGTLLRRIVGIVHCFEARCVNAAMDGLLVKDADLRLCVYGGVGAFRRSGCMFGGGGVC